MDKADGSFRLRSAAFFCLGSAVFVLLAGVAWAQGLPKTVVTTGPIVVTGVGTSEDPVAEDVGLPPVISTELLVMTGIGTSEDPAAGGVALPPFISTELLVMTGIGTSEDPGLVGASLPPVIQTDELTMTGVDE